MAEKFDPSEITNPKKTAQRREDEAMGDTKKGRDMGDLDGPNKDLIKRPGTMSQADFSGYPKNKNEAGLAKALKNRK